MATKKMLGTSLALLLLAGSYWLIHAGELEPPGPPAPTMLSLDRIEPAIPVSGPMNINSSGTYYLTESISGPVSGTEPWAIRIWANDVTLDLNGFSITGSSTVETVICTSRSNIVVRNGTLKGGQANIQFVTGARFSDLDLVASDDVSAMSIFKSQNIRITGCVASNNAVQGFRLQQVADLVVRNCSASNNGSDGMFLAGCSAYVENNNIRANGGAGILVWQQVVTATGTLIGNRCFANDGPGIELATTGTADVVVAGNVSGGNTGSDYDLPASPNVAPIAAAGTNPGAWVNIQVQ